MSYDANQTNPWRQRDPRAAVYFCDAANARATSSRRVRRDMAGYSPCRNEESRPIYLHGAKVRGCRARHARCACKPAARSYAIWIKQAKSQARAAPHKAYPGHLFPA